MCVKYEGPERYKFQCYEKISPHTPGSDSLVLKVTVLAVKCYGDAGNNKIHEVVAIRNVTGWLLQTECLFFYPICRR